MTVAYRDSTKTLRNMPLDRFCKRFLSGFGVRNQPDIVNVGIYYERHDYTYLSRVRLLRADFKIKGHGRNLRTSRHAIVAT